MNIDWHDLGTALALYFVLEGLLPFLNPGLAQRMFASMATAPGRQLRLVGLASMAAGCGLLYLIRG